MHSPDFNVGHSTYFCSVLHGVYESDKLLHLVLLKHTEDVELDLTRSKKKSLVKKFDMN